MNAAEAILDTLQSPLLLDPPSNRILPGYFRIIFDSTLWCLRSGEPDPVPGSGPKRTLAFLPRVVDSRFTAESLLSAAEAIPLAERLERDAFAPFLREPRPAGGRLDLKPWELEQVNRCFVELDIVFSDRTLPLRPCRARAALIRLLYGLGYREEGILPVDAGEPWGELLLFLNREFSRTITIGELCLRFATNRNTLSREFKKLTGHTIGEYLEGLRFRLACRLLRETRLSVTRIAADCGFSDATGMGRVFRMRTGAGSSEWRRGGGNQSP